jgi:hypothetical protein
MEGTQLFVLFAFTIGKNKEKLNCLLLLVLNMKEVLTKRVQGKMNAKVVTGDIGFIVKFFLNSSMLSR